MEFILVPLVALGVSTLTLFSGFGLGTLLMPVFALFFPIQLAIAMTAVVHLLNNLFKLTLLGKHASRQAVLRFGLPAIVLAIVGARALLWLSGLGPVGTWAVSGHESTVTPVKLTVAVLMVVFAVFELDPRLRNLSIDRKYLPVGGALSGFFGGLSGHQGALRSAFLLHAGLEKEAFIASGVVISVMVDVGRLAVYSEHYVRAGIGENVLLLVITTLFAFAGAFAGSRLLRRVTLRYIQLLIGIMLVAIAVGLGTGII